MNAFDEDGALDDGPIDLAHCVSESNGRVGFGNFLIDPRNAELVCDSQSVALTPKAFAVLCCLIESAGRLLTRDELFKKVWPGVVVSDAALTVCIGEIRSVLGDDVKNPRYVETVPKRGYRFVCEIANTDNSRGHDLPPILDRCEGSIIVGRDDGLAKLDRCLELSMVGIRQFAFITGETGIGKTAIVDAFSTNRLDSSDIWLAHGQCIEHYGAGEAYLPLLDALGELARQHGHALSEILRRYAPTWLQHLPQLGDDASLDHPQKKSTGTTQDCMLREFTMALDVIAENRLLVLILEDLHWCDQSTVDVLSFLARRANPARLLVLGTYRSVDAAVANHPVKVLNHDLQQRGCCTTVSLDFLIQEQVAIYLSKVFPGHGFPQEFISMVHQQSDGNPLFMINIINYLKHTDFISIVDGRWVVTGDLQAPNRCLPDDLRVMIHRQIDQLDLDCQNLLEMASVASEPGGIATRFTLTEVATALDIDELDAEQRLDCLANNAHFLRFVGVGEWPDGSFSSHYEFTHVMYQKALYMRVSSFRRIQIHLRLGLRLEQGYGLRSDEIANSLAVHFEQGRDYSRAAKYLKHSAETAAKRGAGREAMHNISKAQRLIPKIPQSDDRDRLELALLLVQGPIITVSQGNAAPEIGDCYRRAGELCERLGEQAEQFRLLFGLRSFYTIRGDLEKASQLASFLQGLAERLDDSGYLLEAEVGLASCEFFAGNHRVSYKHALQGIALYDIEAHVRHATLYGLDPGVFCYARVGQTLWTLGYTDQALDYEMRALDLAESLDHPYSLVFAIHNLTLVHLYRCDGKAALLSASRGKALALQYKFSFLSAWAFHLSAWAFALVGDTANARLDIDRALNAERPIAPAADSYLAVFLAETYRLLGEVDHGQSVLAAPRHEHCYDIERQFLKAEFLLLGDDATSMVNSAEQLYKQACEESRRQGMKAYELRAAIGLSQLLLAQQRHTEAYDCLAEITRWFTEGRDTYEIQQAECQLEKLSAILADENKDSNVVYLSTATEGN